jgi:hypothetical protein
VNEIDWIHVVGEIDHGGLSQLNAVQSWLRQMAVHLLKLHGWPALDADERWRGEIVAFQSDAERGFAPSMCRRIDLAGLYDRAVRQIELTRYHGQPGAPAPATCAVTLDQLLSASCGEPEDAFAAA